MIQFEYCSECGEPTGRAGKADDSIYVELKHAWNNGYVTRSSGTELGPLCEGCYYILKKKGVIDE